MSGIASLSEKLEDKVGYGYTAVYLTKDFSIISGLTDLEEHIKANAKLLLCSTCKSLIYGISLDPLKQAGIGINVNTFDFPNGIPTSFKPVRHVWYANRIVDINDNLPKFQDASKEQFGSGKLMV